MTKTRTVEIIYREHTLRCEVEPGDSGNTAGPPDSWCPPSPDSVEIVAALCDGRECCLEDLLDSFSPQQLDEVEILALAAYADQVAEEQDRDEQETADDLDYYQATS